MSALAARRAASARSAPQVSDDPVPLPAATPASRYRARTPNQDEPAGSSQQTGDVSAEKLPARTAKKRKLVSKSTTASRYYAPAAPEEALAADMRETPSVKKGKARAFSPSHPVGDPYESSDGESSVDLIADQNGREPVDSASHNSGPDAAGPSRPRTLRTTAPAVAASTFKPREGFNFHRISSEVCEALMGVDEPAVLLSLGADEAISLSGMYCITPLVGQLDIFSTILQPPGPGQPLKRHRVFAPKSHPTPSITTSSSQLVPDPTAFRQQWSLPQTFVLPSVANNRAVFVVRELHCGMDGLSNGIVPGFNSIWSRGNFAELRGMALNEDHAQSQTFPYSLPPTWRDALDSLNPVGEDVNPPVVLVRGPKRCGKSTFARTALNNLLDVNKEVAWLECDLGQSEFSPGGVVGLWSIRSPVLGPPFTHPCIPLRAYFLGEYTPLPCPDQYIASIRQLLQYYRYEMPGIPLVINTQGWLKGLGEELLRDIELASEPTHIFTFEADQTADECTGPGWTSSPIVELAPLPSHGSETAHRTLEPAPISPIQSRFTPSDLRILSMMSYLHSTLDSAAATWVFDTPLMNQPPWEVSLGIDSAIKNVYLIGEGSEGIVPEDLALALNGSIVGLLRTEPGPALYEPGRYPSLEDTSCVGMGIVRGIKAIPNGFKLLLLIPVPSESVSQVNAIVKNGAIELPLCALLEGKGTLESRGREEIPFVDSSGVEGVGLEKRRFRRNIMRKGM